MARRVPFMRSVTLTNADTNYNLLTLLRAIDADMPMRAQMVQLQYDPTAGAGVLRIGNPSVLSATDFGVELVGTQAFSIGSLDSNLILLGDIEMRSTVAAKKVHVVVVTR